MHETVSRTTSTGRRGALRIAAPAIVLALAASTVLALPAGSAEPAAQAGRVAVGDEAADFTLESIDGETYRLSDLRGEKNAIVIFFRGTW